MLLRCGTNGGKWTKGELIIINFIINIFISVDCQDYLEQSSNSEPTVISVGDALNSGKAFCPGDGWTVIQSRGQFGNPQDYFSVKTWEDYKNGFGEPGFRINQFIICLSS